MAVKSTLCKYARAESRPLVYNVVAFVTDINSLWERSAAATCLFGKDGIAYRKYNYSYSKIFGSTELGSLPFE